MSLSVCCMTNDPPERVARALAPLRALADQIVVAVDARVADDRLGAYDGIADELYRFNFRPSVERPRAWLASRCRGEWILWIDGDEVLSPAFLDTLPELILDDELAQYWFTRRWLFLDTGHWIDENPWWPDFQVRLIRNKRFTMWFGRMHEPFGFLLPARHLDLPIYHLACIVSSVAERASKAKGYDAVAPGRVSPGGGPFNQVLYLPERYATLRPQLVPPDDRAAIDQVLAAPRLGGRARSTSARPAMTRSTRSAPTESWPTTTITPGSSSSSVTPALHPAARVTCWCGCTTTVTRHGRTARTAGPRCGWAPTGIVMMVS